MFVPSNSICFSSGAWWGSITDAFTNTAVRFGVDQLVAYSLMFCLPVHILCLQIDSIRTNYIHAIYFFQKRCSNRLRIHSILCLGNYKRLAPLYLEVPKNMFLCPDVPLQYKASQKSLIRRWEYGSLGNYRVELVFLRIICPAKSSR